MTLSTSACRRLRCSRASIEVAGHLSDICFLATCNWKYDAVGSFGALRRFNVFRRGVFTYLPLALSRRLIASPEAQDRASYRVK